MQIQPIKTPIVQPSDDLAKVIIEVISELPERSVLAITSKVVSVAEGRIVSDHTTKAALIEQESEWYLRRQDAKTFGLTVTKGVLIPSAGIDESNAHAGGYILWPEDPQTSANLLREQLAVHYGVREFGVILTDSTSAPLRRGTVGISIAHSGFAALKRYVGNHDLFGRRLNWTYTNQAQSLAAAAVVTMGESNEQTPLALITDLPFIEFQEANPTKDELAQLRLSMEDDLYAPLLTSVPWQRGGRGNEKDPQ